MFKYFTTMSTKNKISLILLLQLLLATPLFANSYGLDTVAKVETERCIVRFNVSPADVQATVMYKSALPDAVEIQLGTVNENGSVASFVELGEYDYKVVAQGYITAEGRLVLNKAGGVVVENVALRSKLANITFCRRSSLFLYQVYKLLFARPASSAKFSIVTPEKECFFTTAAKALKNRVSFLT